MLESLILSIVNEMFGFKDFSISNIELFEIDIAKTPLIAIFGSLN